VPTAVGGGEVRIANNTITCDGPWLVVYRHGCAVPELPWETMPSEWVSPGDVVRLSVAKGTLVPVVEMGVRASKRAAASYANAPNAGPKRQRRANAPPATVLGVEQLPPQLRRGLSDVAAATVAAATVAAVAPVAAAPVAKARGAALAPPVGLPMLVVSRGRTDSNDSVTSSASTQAASDPSSPVLDPVEAAAPPPAALPAPVPPVAVAAPAAAAPPPVAVPAKPANVVAATARAPAIVVSSPTLSKQPSGHLGASAASPPGDPAQLAVRLVAAHEHIAALLEGALRAHSPMRSQLTLEQKAGLSEQLATTRQMIEKCVTLARPAPPQPPMPTRQTSETTEVALASLVAMANAVVHE
jgi:hypothetical protein